MKRLFYSTGVFLMMTLFSSCAQHDTTSPDTAGTEPYNQPGVGVDTMGRGAATNPTASDTLSSPPTNYQKVTDGDTSRKDR